MSEGWVGEHGIASFGMACWRGAPTAMSIAHQHDDLEFNASSVALDYLFDGRAVRIPPHTLAVFWAARPHQLLTEAARERVSWLTVPLADALRWVLPGDVVGALLGGAVVLLPERPGLDLDARVAVWAEELAGADEPRRAASAEVEGFARRAALDAAAMSSGSHAVAASAVGTLRPDAVAMASWISRHASEDIRVADVAQQVHLTPQHAMTVFRRFIGITMGEYLVQCRVARAQQLLVTSDTPVAEIGHAAGFQSQSQFYARFRERCGQSPAAYRRRLRR